MTTTRQPEADPGQRRRSLFRTRRPDLADQALPQYSVAAERHDSAGTDGLATVLRRLPHLCAIVIRLAWQADRRAVKLLAALLLLGGILTATTLYATRGALIPLFTTGALDERLRGAAPALVLIAAVGIARSLAAAGTTAITARIGPRVDGLAEMRYLDAATRVPLAAYDDPDWCNHAEAANRASKDTRLMVDSIAATAAGLLGLLAAVGILAALHPLLVPLLLLAVLPRGAAAVRAARAEHLAERHTLADRRLRHTLMFHTAGRPTALDVRANTMRPWLLGQFSTLVDRLDQHARRVGATTARYQLTGDALAGGAMLLVYGTLLWLVVAGHVPLAAAGTAVVAVQTSRILLASLVAGLNTTYRVGLYLGDWEDFIHDAEQRARPLLEPVDVPADPQVIRAEGVTFSYNGSATPALRDVSVTVRQGEVLAIVGANGSGKSTLAKVLVGLYHPAEGAVTWDGVDLAAAPPEQIWARLAILPQDIARWQTDARQNITLGTDHDDDAILAAAAQAGADEVLAGLPDGLDTNLAPSYWSGRDLSPGQWQRLAAARAFLRADAPVLVCDEPTSALDPLAEEAMYERIRRLAEGRTVILITHRLGSTRTADRIIVLNKGTITEEGTHETLLAADGGYAAMWRTQAQTYGDQ
ncbi:ATP-binding cassette domain-containing protein [Kitasatospora sp. NPDC056273]|uniref:ATP-binding cassette domain-containing protein n=1 Tax=Kitasatospora sp. NPDC056273 TaxID=3345769 RepID=UPI0035E2DC93